MSNKLSLYFIIAAVLAVSVFFFHVVKPFLIAIFLGTVLAVLFRPFYRWLRDRLWGYQAVAAAITTAVILLVLLLPVGTALVLAGSQLVQVGDEVVSFLKPDEESNVEEKLAEIEESQLASRIERYYHDLPDQQRQQAQQLGSTISTSIAGEVYQKTSGLIANFFEFLITLAIMTLACYYFLTDGPKFMAELERLLPLNHREELLLEERFQVVCRGVILGTIVSGMAQAVLAGIGFAVLGVGQVWLLGVLTMFASFIPFVGSAAVWGLVSIALAFDGRIGAAIGLAVYGALIVASADNLIRAYVIGNRTHLHPLVALVTVLGAIRLIGLWGIFVGPMLAAFLYALLDVLRQRMEEVERQEEAGRAVALHETETAEVVTEEDLA